MLAIRLPFGAVLAPSACTIFECALGYCWLNKTEGRLSRSLVRLRRTEGFVQAHAQLLVGPVWFAFGEPDGAYKKLSRREH